VFKVNYTENKYVQEMLLHDLDSGVAGPYRYRCLDLFKTPSFSLFHGKELGERRMGLDALPQLPGIAHE